MSGERERNPVERGKVKPRVTDTTNGIVIAGNYTHSRARTRQDRERAQQTVSETHVCFKNRDITFLLNHFEIR